MQTLPIISVGVPCYNNPEGLRRLLDSLLSQTYSNIEIIVSDNCSEDTHVGEIGKEYSKRDERVSYYRQSHNIGAGSNFEFVRDRSSGLYFMWAADDDVFRNNYIEECAKFLTDKSEFVLVGGHAKYRRPDNSIYDGVNVSYENDNPEKRILHYFKTAMDNGIFYGLYRTSVIKSISLKKQFLGNDWLVLGEVACLGKIRVLSTTEIIRDASHLFLEDPWGRLCNMYSLPNFAKRVPWLWMTLEIKYAFDRSNVMARIVNRNKISVTVYKILIKRLVSQYKGIEKKLYCVFTRLYYPYFFKKMR